MALPKGHKFNEPLYVGNIQKAPAINTTPKNIGVVTTKLQDDCYNCDNETMRRVDRGKCLKSEFASPVGKGGISKNPCPKKESEIEEIITEAEVESVKTAGVSQVPTFIWYLLGGVALLYIAKKNKIIKL